MEYTVQKLAKLAGASARTLRYYDEIGLLRPARISSSGYRIYGQREVDLLQHILLYREMGVSLERISYLLQADGFDRLAALRAHEENLLVRQAQLDVLLKNVQKSIAAQEGGFQMPDREKFEGFKHQLVERNERDYGREIREKYGDSAVDESNAKMLSMDGETYAAFERLGGEILRLLDEVCESGDSRGESAGALAKAHRDWLCYTWKEYSAQAHAGLVEMYVQDDRFAKFYDRGTPGKALMLRDCVLAWLEK